LSPFPDIRIKGTHISSKTEKKQGTLIEGAFLNIDGNPLTSFTFVRPFTKASRSFKDFFEVTEGNEGFRSLVVNQFNLTSINRDFDFNRISDYDNGELDQILKEGMIAEIAVSFTEECELSLCELYRYSHHTSNFIKLKGRVEKDRTVFTGKIDPFVIEGHIEL